jgi:hypothetical protein
MRIRRHIYTVTKNSQRNYNVYCIGAAVQLLICSALKAVVAAEIVQGPSITHYYCIMIFFRNCVNFPL